MPTPPISSQTPTIAAPRTSAALGIPERRPSTASAASVSSPPRMKRMPAAASGCIVSTVTAIARYVEPHTM